MQPLAEQIRPTCLEEVVGQQHLLAPNRFAGLLRAERFRI